MSFTLTSKLSKGYLRIDIDGRWPRENPEDLISEIYVVWSKHQCTPLLIDVRRMKDETSIIQDYENAKLFAAAGFQKISRVAVLDSPSRREANDFFETTSSNRGLIFRFFYSVEQDAINWLLQ